MRPAARVGCAAETLWEGSDAMSTHTVADPRAFDDAVLFSVDAAHHCEWQVPSSLVWCAIELLKYVFFPSWLRASPGLEIADQCAPRQQAATLTISMPIRIESGARNLSLSQEISGEGIVWTSNHPLKCLVSPLLA